MFPTPTHLTWYQSLWMTIAIGLLGTAMYWIGIAKGHREWFEKFGKQLTDPKETQEIHLLGKYLQAFLGFGILFLVWLMLALVSPYY